MIIIAGIFFILHGLVHLLYFGQSVRSFELQPGMEWPDDAWLFSPFFKKKAVRVLAGYFCILAAIGFVVTGIGVLAHHDNWYFLAISSSAFSAFLYLFFWNGKYEKLNDQGAIAILINAIIFVCIVIFNWPQFNF